MEQALYESSPQVKIPHLSAAILQLVERRAWLPNMGENFLAILQSCSCDTVRPDPLPKENNFSHQPIFFDCEGAGRAKGLRVATSHWSCCAPRIFCDRICNDNTGSGRRVSG